MRTTGTRIDLEVRSPILWLQRASGSFAEGVTQSLDLLASLLASPAGPAFLAP